MKKMIAVVFVLGLAVPAHSGDYLGQLSQNPYTSGSTAGRGYQDFRIKQSMSNRFTTGGPKLYDDDHNYRGTLNGNRYDPDSISNPYGRYGSRYSPDSINNPYGAGSRYRPDSPNNPYGSGWSIYDE